MANKCSTFDQSFVDNLPYLLTKEHVARLIGSSVRYVQNHYGELTGLLLGGRLVFYRPKVLDFLGLHRTQDAEA